MTLLHITPTETDGLARLNLAGDLSADGEEVLQAAFEDAVTEGAKVVLIDLAGVAYINTTGISILLVTARRAREDDIRLAVCGASPHYQRVFDLVQFGTFVDLFPDAATATAALVSPSS